METNGGPAGATPAWLAVLGEPQRLWRRLLGVPRVAQTALRTRVGTSAHDVVLREGTHTLLHYHRDTPATHAEPVLLCYALVNRPYILDLQPNRSVVQQYLRRGFDVYLIDWGVPSDGDRGLTLADYVDGFLSRAVEAVRDRQAGAKIHLVGYCMGGTLSALYAALEPQAPATLTLLAAPIDFGGRESLLNLWTQAGAFDVDALVDAYGNCPGWFLQTAFLAMNPVRNFLDKAFAFYEQMDDPGSLESHFALEHWLNDNIPVAGETFREFVGKLYQRNELVRGLLRLGERTVDLRRIACPVLLLTATSDHLVAPEATEGIRPHLGSRDVTSMSIAAGHVGLVVGGRAHERFWPEATGWTAERSTPPQPAEAPPPAPPRNLGKRRPVPEPRWWALDR